MKNIIRNSVLVISSLLITSGVAFAMKPDAVQPTVTKQNNSIEKPQETAPEAPVETPAPTEPETPAPVITPPPAPAPEPTAPVSHVELMTAAGIDPADFGAVEYIIGRENASWDPLRKNMAGSSAYGLCQALPGSKMASAGPDWETNPVTQLKWCSGYAQARYGGWRIAAKVWEKQGWW